MVLYALQNVWEVATKMTTSGNNCNRFAFQGGGGLGARPRVEVGVLQVKFIGPLKKGDDYLEENYLQELKDITVT